MEFTYCDNTFSDLFKDVNGFRPRGQLMEDWEDRTPRQKQELWNALCDELADNEKAERKLEKEQVATFEARIQDVIGLGAGDRETALRWIASQETFYHGQCVEHFVWEQGVLFTDYGRKLVKELAKVVTYVEMEMA